MANPILAVYYDDGTNGGKLVRFYELADNGTFVQLAATGVTNVTNSDPKYARFNYFINEFDQPRYLLSYPRSGGEGNAKVVLNGADYAVVGSMVTQGAAAGTAFKIIVSSLESDAYPQADLFLDPKFNSTVAGMFRVIQSSPTNGLIVGDGSQTLFAGAEGIVLDETHGVTSSPDGDLLFVQYTSGATGARPTNSGFYKVSGYQSNFFPRYETRYGDSSGAINSDIIRVAWSERRDFFFAGSLDGKVACFRDTGASFDFIYTIEPPADHEVSALDFAFDRRTLAVGYKNTNTNTFITRLFLRTGNSFSQIVEYSDVGEALSFSADGLLLVDGCQAKAYQRTDLSPTTPWSDVSAPMMNNIAANGWTQILVSEIEGKVSNGTVYPNSLEWIISNAPSMPETKFMILSGDATFDASHATLDQVTGAGAYEVSGNNWPAGGVTINNISLTSIGLGIVGLGFDDFSQVIVGGDLDFRYGLFYSGTTPLVHVDFASDQKFVQNTEISFLSGDNGLITFST
jgi:WD40 repeat protein